MSQPVLPLLPAEATPIGATAGLSETADGGVVYVCGLVTFTYAAGDELGRRLAAVQLLTCNLASMVEVAEAFAVSAVSLWRWRKAFSRAGVDGLRVAKAGPKGPRKLTVALAAAIVELRGQGLSLAAVAEQSGVSTDTVRRALAGAQPNRAPGSDAELGEPGGAGEAELAGGHARSVLPLLAEPTPRIGERQLARAGLLIEAPARFTPAARVPMAGLALILATPSTDHLLGAFEATYARLRNGFYGLRPIVLTLLFLALLRDPRAEGLTRHPPVDLGRLLGLDRAPEVKTLRRKLTELAGHRRGAALGAALARAHAAARPEVLAWLHVDGHTRAYTGARELPKTRISRLHMAGHAVGETWVADARADPLLVIPALPTAALATELVRALPELRKLIGEDRRATVIFDRGGWSPATFATLIEAGFDILTYRKAPYDLAGAEAFTAETFTAPDGRTHSYALAETTVGFEIPGGATLPLRQIMRLTDDAKQIAILTSAGAPGAECAWRLAARWREVMWARGCLTEMRTQAKEQERHRREERAGLVKYRLRHLRQDHVST